MLRNVFNFKADDVLLLIATSLKDKSRAVARKPRET